MQTATVLHVLSPRGRSGVRGPSFWLAALACAAVLASAAAAHAATDDRDVSVREHAGVFTVAAQFSVPQSPAAVLAFLTDYEGIPKAMPDVTRSVVRSRSGDRVIVEQEAVSRVLFFSKTVHLLLDVHEADASLTFRDTCGRSFALYEGTWRVTAGQDATLVTYELRAQPSFDVPDFLLKRLLRRDAGLLIARLRQAIGS